MSKLKPQEPPPPDYYAANLRHLFRHVADFYDDLLTGEEQGYLRAFLGTTPAAQRLYARLLSRKGPWIRVDRLNYREIDDLDVAVDTLTAAGLIERNAPAPADALLGLLTQAERKALFPNVAGTRKSDWIADCLGRHQDEWIRHRLRGRYAWVSLARHRQARLIQLLFFGDDRQDPSTFVLMDLGLMRFERYGLERSQRQFPDRIALDRFRRLRRLNRLAHRLEEAAGLADWLAGELILPARTRQEERQRDRTLNHLGAHHERRGELDRALECFGRSRMHPGRERRTRILAKLEDRTGVECLLEKMAREPRCAEEVDFAGRFGRRMPRGDQPVTTIPLAEAPAGNIETHACDLLSSGGALAFHLENALPRGLAGLAYWAVIFEPLPGAFTNPFQMGPLDLFWPDFAEARAESIARRTRELSEPGAMRRALETTFMEKQGVANRLVSWRHFDGTLLETLLRYVPEASLLALARHVIRWPYRTRNGFPDLTVIYGRDNFEFVEVKGPTDQLQPGQRVWLKSLAGLGLRARVLKFKAC